MLSKKLRRLDRSWSGGSWAGWHLEAENVILHYFELMCFLVLLVHGLDSNVETARGIMDGFGGEALRGAEGHGSGELSD